MRTLDYYTGPEVLPVWGEVKALVQKSAAHSRGEWKASDVLIRVHAGQQHLWIFRDEGKVQAVAVTSLDEYPRKTVCNIYAMSGFGMAGLWEEFYRKLTVWLEVHGVEEIQATCRDEVMEKLLPLGFTKTANVLSFKWKGTP